MRTSNVAEMIEGYSDDRYLMGERNDCTVVALASALKMSYKAAHKLAKKHGREDRRGMITHAYYSMLNKISSLRPMSQSEITTYYKSTGKLRANKLSTFIKRYPKGTYILSVRQHTVTVEDGVVLERGTPANWHVNKAWEVKVG